ncbi:u8 snoRNA-decapping enzyme [Trichonephila clavipes]|nr:u8 snoRNA-decapping enzyme [Trichonephila clavipes]
MQTCLLSNTEDLQLPQTKNETPATVEPNATASKPATVESDPTASTPTQPSTRSGRKVHLPTSFQKALELTGHRHAAHCCIYAPCPTPVLQHYTSSALVSMQMRFDGLLGFHGGLVTEKDIVSGLNRELKEEINLDEKFFVTDKDYLFSYIEVSNKLCLHLYGKNVTKKDFEDIERNVHTARDFGKETMGLFRVPMFTMDDGYYGLPAFLNNCFVENP